MHAINDHWSLKTLKILIDRGADINLKCKNGDTLLHKASKNDNFTYEGLKYHIYYQSEQISMKEII